MHTLNFRGRMAAVIVAILLITTIFLAVPVSASESCDHENTSLPSYSPQYDDSHLYEFSCFDCGEYISISEQCTDFDDNGVCDDCEASLNGCPHSNVYFDYTDNEDGLTHSWYSVCSSCYYKELLASDSAHEYLGDTCKLCLYVDPNRCQHINTNLPTYTPNNDGATHTIRTECIDCGYVYIKDDDPCSGGSESGVCEECGQGVSCTHDVLEFRYSENGDGTHKWESVCSYCGYDEIVLMKKPCEYVNGICKYCKSMQRPVASTPEGVIPAYVFIDADGRWTVIADEYFGGINYLDLVQGNDPYIHSKSTVSFVSKTSNEIIFKDHDGGFLSGNNRIVDMHFDFFNFAPGGTYYFDAKIDSPYPNVSVSLVLVNSSGKKTYVSPGSTFEANDLEKIYLNFKTNTKTQVCYGSPFEVRFYDLMISDQGNTTFEPFGVRYFNNTMAYDDYVTARKNLNLILGEYASGLDYIGSVANGASYSKFKDKVLKTFAKVESFVPTFPFYYSDFYFDHSEGNTEISKLLSQYEKGGTFEYNKGYTDGYSSAVKDFEGVSDGGFVEGLINGAFKSISDSWYIINSGISVSGISVGGIVSTMVILVVVYFALKLIAR